MQLILDILTLLNVDALHSKKAAHCSLQADAMPQLRSVGAGRQEKSRSSFEGQVYLRVTLHPFPPAVYLNSKGHTILNSHHLTRFIRLQENLEEEMRKMEACLMSSTTYHISLVRFYGLLIFADASCKSSNHFVSLSRNNFKKTSKQNFNLRQGNIAVSCLRLLHSGNSHRCQVT